MSSSTQLEHYDVPSSNPLETPTFSFRVGKHLGRFFVAAKNKATDKYKQVTSGINQSIEDEEARRLCELQIQSKCILFKKVYILRILYSNFNDEVFLIIILVFETLDNQIFIYA